MIPSEGFDKVPIVENAGNEPLLLVAATSSSTTHVILEGLHGIFGMSALAQCRHQAAKKVYTCTYQVVNGS